MLHSLPEGTGNIVVSASVLSFTLEIRCIWQWVMTEHIIYAPGSILKSSMNPFPVVGVDFLNTH